VLHIRYASLDLSPRRQAEVVSLLSREERQRAGRICQREKRDRWCAARGILRELLNLYLNRAPGEIILDYNSSGKPFLPSGEGPDLPFSLSRSGGRAVYCFSPGPQVGIDLEQIRPRRFDLMARKYFTPAEYDLYGRRGTEEKSRAFYTLWTRKEALLKARGTGISLPLKGVETGSPAEPPGRWDSSAAPGWSLVSLSAGAEYVAALAVEGPPPMLKITDLDD